MEGAAPRYQPTLVTRFVFDTFADGRRFRILCIVDDFSRECLATVVDTSLSGIRVARELDRLTCERATPTVLPPWTSS
jgi:putative transposase